jgi:FkbM family methyltransferase
MNINGPDLRRAEKTKALAVEKRKLDNASHLGLHAQQMPDPTCALPQGASWCWVYLKGLPPFPLALRDGSIDFLAKNVCKYGFWEHYDFSVFGSPGHAVDIGGNVGYFAFALAQSGWSVTTFEPMQSNREFMQATICANPAFAQKVDIQPFGLGTSSQFCKFIFHYTNIGNAVTRCAGDKNLWWQDMDGFNDSQATAQPEFQIRRLDEMVDELQAQGKLQQVDFVKIDVEGYECEVLRGAPNFISQFAPRKVKMEVWNLMERCSPAEFITNNFWNNGYTVSHDVNCAVPEWDIAKVPGEEVYACR